MAKTNHFLKKLAFNPFETIIQSYMNSLFYYIPLILHNRDFYSHMKKEASAFFDRYVLGEDNEKRGNDSSRELVCNPLVKPHKAEVGIPCELSFHTCNNMHYKKAINHSITIPWFMKYTDLNLADLGKTVHPVTQMMSDF